MLCLCINVDLSPVKLDKSSEINPEELKMCTIVRYDPQYNIIKVVLGGGELEEGKVSEHDFFGVLLISRNI